MFGVNGAVALGRPLLEVVPNAGISDICARVLSRGAAVSGEAELALPVKGSFSVNATPIFASGSISGCLMVVRDVTELRRLETMRRDFVANVSHELKTPLTAIRGYAETLAEGAIDDRATALEFLSTIRAQTLRLDNIVSDLLKLSSLESQAAAVNKSPVELKRLADTLIAGLASLFASRNAVVVNNIPAGLFANADADKLSQVFVNLLDNAVKFSVVAPNVNVRAERTPAGVKVYVSDNGIGIPAASLPRVFERFYRVDKARSREMGGTGLGLSIVKHIVELHGGAAGVDSIEGSGSTFWFTLPD
jgi:two-component system phosphate regulon sensor histidine kinase PhoR